MPKSIRNVSEKIVIYGSLELNSILFKWFLITIILLLTAVTRASLIRYSTVEQKGSVIHLIDNTKISKIIIGNSEGYIFCWDYDNDRAIIILRDKVSYIEK